MIMVMIIHGHGKKMHVNFRCASEGRSSRAWPVNRKSANGCLGTGLFLYSVVTNKLLTFFRTEQWHLTCPGSFRLYWSVRMGDAARAKPLSLVRGGGGPGSLRQPSGGCCGEQALISGDTSSPATGVLSTEASGALQVPQHAAGRFR